MTPARDDAPRPTVDDTPLLPSQTRDDLDDEWEPRRPSRISADEQRLLDERPPHWG